MSNDKQAARIAARKKQGFVTHLKAIGRSDQTIATRLPKYAHQDANRTRNLIAAREAIIPSR
jgi:hypothetical protein